ncbi:hypothetical protein FRC18_007984 [Serendipita sp. 400]|nr:hypothetical protein FRC18_007984 [Serendipita sp. 400]
MITTATTITKNRTHGHIPKRVSPSHLQILKMRSKYMLAMTSRPIVVSSAVFVTLVGMNEAGFFNIEDGKHPITKFMSSKLSSKETILEENLQAIEMVKEQAANYRLEKSARQDMFRPQKGIGPAANGSPHGLPVRPQVDISDIKPKRPPRE